MKKKELDRIIENDNLMVMLAKQSITYPKTIRIEVVDK